jgi:hypothetical protein
MIIQILDKVENQLASIGAKCVIIAKETDRIVSFEINHWKWK